MARASTPVARDEVHRLVGVGEQLVVRQLALRAVAVLLLAHAGLQGAEHAELALDRDAARVGHLHHLARDVDVVVVVGRASCRPPSGSRPSSPR